MMKRLFLVLGAVVAASIAMPAQAGSTTFDFNFTVPTFAYIYTDLSSVAFDFSATSVGSNKGKLATLNSNALPVAQKSELAACISNLVNNLVSSPVQPANAAGTNSLGTCGDYAPTSVSTSGMVDWSSFLGTGNTGGPDGTLLVITNDGLLGGSGVSVSAQITSSTASGVTLKVLPDIVKNGNLLNSSPSSLQVVGNTSSTAAYLIGNGSSGVKPGDSANDALYYTNYVGVWAIPTLWAASIDPTQATSGTVTVTFTAVAY